MFNKFFRLSIHALAAKIQPDKVTKLSDGAKMASFACCISASRVQHISNIFDTRTYEPYLRLVHMGL